MKKKLCFVVFVVLTAVFVLALSACAIGGEECVKGKDGRDGRDGLSAYEIFCKNYIYIESEKQWIDDLVSGTLERVDNSVLEEKLYWDGDIDDDFEPGEVLLTIDKYFYQKRFTVEDFHMIDIEKAELISDYTDGGQKPGYQMYLLTLKEKSKQAVIDAIYKLEIYAFTKLASPNEMFAPVSI